MKAYSIDLRERVAAVCVEPGARMYQVAARFGVSISFVDKLLHRQRTTNSFAALPARGGPAPRLDAAVHALLTACLRQQSDATLLEVGAALAAAGGPALSRTSMWRAVEKLGWKRKKSIHAAERVVVLRRLLVETVLEEDFTRLVFVDEMRLKHLGPAPP